MHHIPAIRRINSAMIMVAFLLFLQLPGSLYAQFYYGSQQNFGRSRVSYIDFLWTHYRFDDFDTYFYLNGEHLAAYTAFIAQQEIPRIASMLETSLQDKLQFVIFNRLSDVRQSNIGLQNEMQYTYNTGGITHIVGKRVFLYFDGNYNHFDRQIRAGIANVLIQQSLYGGSISGQVVSSAMSKLPQWYINGLVSYIAEPWSVETDNIVRNAFLTNRYKRFNQLEGQDAMYAGHSVWKYIADKYGETMLSNLVYMNRLGRSPENGIVYILGISLKTLLKEWEEYYHNMYEFSGQNLPTTAKKIDVKNRKGEVYQNLRICPDGRNIAYVSNHLGRYKVILHDMYTNKKKVLLRGGYRLDEIIDLSYPLMAWHPSGRLLAMIAEDKGFLNLYFYNLDDRETTQQYMVNFEKVLHFQYSDDGFYFVLSGVQKGETDLYLYHIPSNSCEKITNDIFDDNTPAFINKSGRVLFSSKRPADSLDLTTRFDFQPASGYYNLFMYDRSKKSKTLRRMIYEPTSNQTHPLEYEKNYFSYLSDESGITNRYLGRFDSVIAYVDTATHYRYFVESMAVTDYPGDIVSYDINHSAGLLGEIVFYKDKYFIGIQPLEPPEELVATHPGISTYVAAKFQNLPEISKKEGAQEKPVEIKPKRFRSVMENEVESKIHIDDIVESDYVLFTDTVPQELIPRRLEVQPEKTKDTIDKFRVPKRLNYNVEYFIDQLVSQFDFTYMAATYQPFTGSKSPLFLSPGLNAFLSVSLIDLLEDYRIIGGVRLSPDFVNNEYLLSLRNYKHRLNKEYLFYRQTIDETRESQTIRNYQSLVRHKVHELHYILTWPFTRVLSLKSSLVLKNDKAVYLALDRISLQEADQTRNWAGFKAELIYDDSKSLGTNLFQGTRGKLFGEYYQGITKDHNNMVVLGADLRNYLPIHRNFIWANRFAASTSFGNNLLMYYLGGVDNWLLPKFDQEMNIDHTRAFAYQTLATNLRGFQQNIRNGNSFVVVNTELRFPVFRYFLKRPINMQFINDFQIIGFADAGTAWTGLHPFMQGNHLFRKHFEQQPLSGWIEIQKEPVVAGLGAGIRTSLLGYFVRGDVAWGFEDKRFLKPVFYLSFGTDF